MLLAGILPFGAMFIELFFIFSVSDVRFCANHVLLFQAIWENQFYYLFGFLFLVCLILGISCAQISIVVTYFQLCSEVCFIVFMECNGNNIILFQNYHWWWKSFVISGGSAVYGKLDTDCAIDAHNVHFSDGVFGILLLHEGIFSISIYSHHKTNYIYNNKYEYA